LFVFKRLSGEVGSPCKSLISLEKIKSLFDINELRREVHPQGGEPGDLEILVHFGIWFNIKPSWAGSLTLNHFENLV